MFTSNNPPGFKLWLQIKNALKNFKAFYYVFSETGV